MPRVPSYNGQQVSTSPLPGVRVPGSAPQGAFMPAEPIDTTGVQRLLAHEVERQRTKADQIATLEADNHLAKLETDLRTKAFERRGKDALGATAEIEDGWLKGVGEIEKTVAKTDRQRQALKARASGRWAQLYETVERHASSEARRYDDETTKAALNTRVNDATANFSDPKAVAVALLEAQAIVRDYAQRNGLSPEVRDDQLAEVVSGIHTGVLNRMLSAGDDRSANAYYQKAKGEIKGDDQAKIEKALQTSNTLAAAQRETDLIIATKGVTRESAFAQARQIADPDIRKETEQMLDVEFARQDRAERDLSEQRFKQAFDYANQGRRPPSPLWSVLTPGQQVNIDERIRQVSGGDADETDLDTYYKLMVGAADNPVEFAKQNLLEVRSRLSASDFKKMVDLQARLRTGDDTEIRGLETENDIREQWVEKLYPNAHKRGNEDRDRANEFRRRIDNERQRWLETNGKSKMPTEEFRALVEKMSVREVLVPREPLRVRVPRLFGQLGVARVTVPGIGDEQVKLEDVQEDERGRAYVPTSRIPPAALEDIQNDVREKSGRIVSSRQVERAFAAWVRGDQTLYQSIIREGAQP